VENEFLQPQNGIEDELWYQAGIEGYEPSHVSSSREASREAAPFSQVQMSSIERLPQSSLFLIFSCLDQAQLSSVRGVCRGFSIVASSESLWRDLALPPQVKQYRNSIVDTFSKLSIDSFRNTAIHIEMTVEEIMQLVEVLERSKGSLRSISLTNFTEDVHQWLEERSINLPNLVSLHHQIVTGRALTYSPMETSRVLLSRTKSLPI